MVLQLLAPMYDSNDSGGVTLVLAFDYACRIAAVQTHHET